VNSRQERRLLLAVGFVILLGLAFLIWSIDAQRASQVPVDVGGKSILVYGASEQQIVAIQSSFTFLQQPVKESVTAIYVLDTSESYRHFGDSGFVGDCHSSGEICIVSHYFDYRIIWHEASHAYTYTLSYAFKKEWLEAAGRIHYGAYAVDAGFPRDGILTSYGSTDWREDVAEWVAEIYSFISHLEYYISHLEHGSFCRGAVFNMIVDMSDPRYHQKLKFLLKWEFISEENYNHIKPLFE